MFFLHVFFTNIKFEDSRNEELLRADVVGKMLQDIQGLVHTGTLPPDLPWQCGFEEDEADPEEDLDPLAEEHVPDAEDRGPGQGPGEDAEEPLGHVEDRLDTLRLDMLVDAGVNLPQQAKQDVTVQLDGLHPNTETIGQYMFKDDL